VTRRLPWRRERTRDSLTGIIDLAVVVAAVPAASNGEPRRRRRLTHIESAHAPATVGARLPKPKGARAMKQQAVQYVALDVHQGFAIGPQARQIIRSNRRLHSAPPKPSLGAAAAAPLLLRRAVAARR
jgi:hypothetical protein